MAEIPFYKLLKATMFYISMIFLVSVHATVSNNKNDFMERSVWNAVQSADPLKQIATKGVSFPRAKII